MENGEVKKVIPVQLPEGEFSGYVCCADCRFGEYDSKREEVWCGYYRRWLSPTDRCSHGEFK